MGLVSETILLSEDVDEDKLIKIIHKLNKDTNFHGILVQLPLPRHINSQKIITYIIINKANIILIKYKILKNYK